MMHRTKVFVSYSHDDHEWLEKFLQQIAVLVRRGLVDVWSDTQIGVGNKWEREIENALSAAKVAVLLVSPAFLASDYIWDYEMPRIIEHSKQGMDILPLIVRPCPWRLEETLATLQARPSEGRPLSLGNESQIDSDLTAFVYELAARIGRSPAAMKVTEISGSSNTRVNKEAKPFGEWIGKYNQTRPIRLLIHEVEDEEFRGKMKYPSEGISTIIKGSLHERWSLNDPFWAQISGGDSDKNYLGVSFREVDYEKRGRGSISFNGEYRALMKEDKMTGAWFSGGRLVGSFTLHRI